jgi:hypothetical protein
VPDAVLILMYWDGVPYNCNGAPAFNPPLASVAQPASK